MKHNKWCPPDFDRGEIFYNTHVPASLKIPVLGKFVVYTSVINDWDESWQPTTEDLELVAFERGIHMISSIELSHPKPKYKIDNIKCVKVLWNDTYKEIDKGEIRSWLYCSVTDQLKKYHISITGPYSFYPKATIQNLIVLNGGEYNYKPNDQTNLIINCSPVPTKALAYAKKHNIKLISESEFFQLLA